MGSSFGPLPSDSGPVGCARMTELSDDEIAEFSQLVAELQQRLEQSFTAHDQIIARQVANEEENARLRAELADVSEPLASMRDLATRASELPGKLHEALKPATLDDKVREEVDGLIRSLTENLEQLAQLARRDGPITGNSPAPSEGSGDSCPADSSSDPWAAEIKALSEEFPDQVFSVENRAPVPSDDEELDPEHPKQQSG
jgi:ABC-type transporter Mla subunit MlaD